MHLTQEERDILRRLAQALPKLSDADKKYLLGIGAGIEIGIQTKDKPQDAAC